MMVHPKADTPAMIKLADAFEKKAADRTLVVGVMGLGYVGLPLAQAYCRQGFKVIGFE